MPQAGIHGLAGMAVRNMIPQQEWLLLGIVLGNFVPDLDNLAVAAATLSGSDPEGLHRTFSHSIFFAAGIVMIFYLFGRISRKPRWGTLGVGLGLGVIMHIAIDLLLWFNGVALLWPIPTWVNLWGSYAPPDWFSKLLMPAEFLFFGAFLAVLAAKAQRIKTNPAMIPRARIMAAGQFILFGIFTLLVYMLFEIFTIPYGALYLISLGLVVWAVIRMRETVDSFE